jgi:hypothetical protein
MNNILLLMRLKKLSICECGFTLLNEDIKLGTQYLIYPKMMGYTDFKCGGCGTELLMNISVGASCVSNPKDEPRLLPMEIFV